MVKRLAIVLCFLFVFPMVTAFNFEDAPTPNSDYYMEVSQGKIPGSSVVNKFGANYAVGTSDEVIWDYGNGYNWLDTAVYLQLSSSDVDDTILGTGARTVIVQGLDENWAEYSETVELSGQSLVNTTGKFIRVFRMLVDDSGSSDGNEGDVYASTGGVTSGVPDVSTEVYAMILNGHGQTLMAIYTIPAGKNGYLLKGFVTSDGTKNVNVHYYNKPFGKSNNVKFDFDTQVSGFIYGFGVPAGAIQPKTDLWVAAAVDAGTSKISAGFDIILVDV